MSNNDWPVNRIFGRESIAQSITDILLNLKGDTTEKKAVYVHSYPGTGKTTFVMNLLNALGYEAILYNATDVRNKQLFVTIDSNNLSNCSILDLMYRRVKRIVIVMDEIDGMNNGDKGGIDALIKLVRPKKTKKQKAENTTLNPIICIGNHKNDKKIRELIKACHSFELKEPTSDQMVNLLCHCIPVFPTFSGTLKEQIVAYIQGDLRKCKFICNMWKTNPELLPSIQSVFHMKIFNEDTKTITCRLLNSPYPLIEHQQFMNETDRTTVALLWHENIATPLMNYLPNQSIPFYRTILDNFCFADYMSRITFQSQIWQFNEMCSLIKTFYNNTLYHSTFPAIEYHLKDVEFTKILTKYSTEYNNQGFIFGLCQKMNMDKNDMISFFHELQLIYNVATFVKKKTRLDGEKKNDWTIQVHNHLWKYDIDILDIKRMYRFLDQNLKKDDTVVIDDDDVCSDGVSSDDDNEMMDDD